MCASVRVDERESDKEREREGVCVREKVRKEAPLKRTKECS